MYLYPAQDKEYLITTSVSALFFISCSLCSIASSVCAWRTRITLFTCVRRCILSHTSTIRHSWPQLKGLRVNIIDCWSRLCSAGKHAHRETLVNGLLRWSPADNIISFGQGPDGSTCRNTHTEVHTHTHTAWRQFHSVIVDFHWEIIDCETGRERRKAWEEEAEEIWPTGEEQHVRKC